MWNLNIFSEEINEKFSAGVLNKLKPANKEIETQETGTH